MTRAAKGIADQKYSNADALRLLSNLLRTDEPINGAYLALLGFEDLEEVVKRLLEYGLPVEMLTIGEEVYLHLSQHGCEGVHHE